MIDVGIVLFYLIALLATAIYQRTKKSGFGGFARVTDSTKKNKLILVATIFASSIGGGTTFGISEKAFADNIAHSYGLFLAIAVDLLIAAYIIPRIVRHYGAESVGDIMSYYYGNSGRYIAGIATIMVSVGLLAAQISVSGRIFEYILQINYVYGVIMSYGIIVVYSTIGGLRSILYANQLQFFAIICAIPIVTIFGIYNIGLENFIAQIPNDKIYPSDNPVILATTVSAFLGFCVMNLFPTFIQRAIINQDPRPTQKAIYIKSFIYGVFLILITLNGLIAYMSFPDQPAGLALPILIDRIIPTGFQGIVIAGLLAAVLSTADSDLNVTSISLVKDFPGSKLRIKDQHKLLAFARIANILVGSGAIFIALCFKNVVDLVIFIAGFWGPIILVPLVMALYDRTVTPSQMVCCVVAGSLSFILWEAFYSSPTSLKGVFVGTIVNLAAFIICYIVNYSKLTNNN